MWKDQIFPIASYISQRSCSSAVSLFGFRFRGEDGGSIPPRKLGEHRDHGMPLSSAAPSCCDRAGAGIPERAASQRTRFIHIFTR